MLLKSKCSLLLLLIYSIFIFALSSVPGSDIPSAVSSRSLFFHFLLYSGYGFTIYLFFRKYPTSLIFGALYAASDEFHQYFVPGRHCDPVDWSVDMIGITVSMIIIFLWKRLLEKRYS